MVKLKGFDVSEHNGLIDWEKVKASGIQFAMIRAGYGEDIPTQDDKQFARNTSECERLGIPYGVYFYSYALNVDGVKSEIAHISRLLNGKKPTYPIAFDMEDADGYKKKHGMPSNDVLVDICDTWLNAIESQGHYVVLYASLDWLNNQLNNPKLDRYNKWVAEWGQSCNYSKTHCLWQYSDAGLINGISGNVDLNYSYIDFAPQPKPTPAPVRKLVLPAKNPNGTADNSWTVYKLGHPCLKSNPDNIAGHLNPALFGGLTYDILKDNGNNIFEIQTQSFGRVQIYAGPETGAKIV